MGNCPFPYMLAFIAPFILAIFRTAGIKPDTGGVKPLTRVPGRALPHQRPEDVPNGERELAGAGR